MGQVGKYIRLSLYTNIQFTRYNLFLLIYTQLSLNKWLKRRRRRISRQIYSCPSSPCQKDAKGPTPNNLQRSLLLRTKPKMYNYKRLTKTASQLLPKPPNYYLRLRPTHAAASDKFKHKKCANTSGLLRLLISTHPFAKITAFKTLRFASARHRHQINTKPITVFQEMHTFS